MADYLSIRDEAAALNLYVAAVSRRRAAQLVVELRQHGCVPANPFDTRTMALALWFEDGRKRHAKIWAV